MPTPAERLAVLEQLARENRDRLERIEDSINGGGDTAYDRSVRGRMHKIESTLAGMVLRRSAGLGMLKSWQSVILILCAVGTVAASWYAAIGH